MNNSYLMAAVAVGMGCGGSGSSHGAADAPGSAVDARGSGDASTLDAFESISGSGMVTDESGSGIAGASVCIINIPGSPCVTTDINGNYTLPIPDEQGSDVAFEATATGFLGLILTYFEPVDMNGEHGVIYPGGFSLFSVAQATTLLGSGAGFTYPTSTTGFAEILIAGVNVGSLTGATATLTPASGTGPVYLDGSGNPDPALTSTTTSGGVLFGNLAPGVYSVTATATGKTCSVSPTGPTLGGDWPPMGSATLSLEVGSNALTSNMTIICQ